MVKKIILIITVLIIGGIGIWKVFGQNTNKPVYQTAKAEKGNIVVTVASSGLVSTANSAEVTTKASGVIKKIYIQNGQKVTSGQVLAEINLDMEGQQRNSAAYASYQSAKNSLYSLQSSMLTKWKTYMDLAQNTTGDARQLPQFMSTDDDWLAAEAAYKNQQNTITANWISYQQSSPIIYAPISGTVTGFGLQIGSVITAQANSSGGSTAQKIASIITEATPTVTVNLTEIDVPKVKIGNKVTLTLDAFPNKTYTGKVISVDTVGSATSNVTTYPAVIKLDTDAKEILTNMSATANIITDFKDNVLLVPSGAVQTQDNQTTVRVLKNNAPQSVNVEIGLTSTTQTEIVSGLSEGDEIITGTTSPTTTPAQTSSPFGSTFRMGR